MPENTHIATQPDRPACCIWPQAGQIYQKIYSDMYPELLRFLTGLNHSEDDAEDLISDVFSTILHRLNRGEWECKVTSAEPCDGRCMRHYVMKVVRVRAREYNRYKKEIIWPDEYWDLQKDDSSFVQDLEQKQVAENQIALLRALVSELSPKEMKLILKRYFGIDVTRMEDKPEYIETYEELAQWMNISKENAQVINSRAIKKLARMARSQDRLGR